MKLSTVSKCVVGMSLYCLMGVADAQRYRYIATLGDISPSEMAALPEYCPRTEHGWPRLSRDSTIPPKSHWYEVMGSGFEHMHHYCQGLTYLVRMRFKPFPAHEKIASWTQAVNEFDYVLNHTTADFVLRPEVLTRRGEVLANLGRRSQAVADFERAIELKPNYWPAAAGLTRLHLVSGDLKSARAVLEEGLKQSPNARQLKELLTEVNAASSGTRKRAPDPTSAKSQGPVSDSEAPSAR